MPLADNDDGEGSSSPRTEEPTAPTPAAAGAASGHRPTAAEAAAQTQQQEQQEPGQEEQERPFVDILQHLPLDVVFQVEVFLPVPTLLGASVGIGLPGSPLASFTDAYTDTKTTTTITIPQRSQPPTPPGAGTWEKRRSGASSSTPSGRTATRARGG